MQNNLNFSERIKFFILLIPIFFSYLLVAAHFYRRGNSFLTLIIICIPLVLFFKKRFSIYIIQTGLIVSIVVWIKTFIFLNNIYTRYNMPFTKTGIILSGVIIVSALSILILRLKIFKKVYFKQ